MFVKITCTKCLGEKPSTEFRPRSGKPGKFTSWCIPCLLEKQQAWRSSEVGREYDRKKKRASWKYDELYRLRLSLRRRLWHALHGHSKISPVRHLGCSLPELKVYLEERFQYGMSWSNYGEWEIDHILPLAKFDLTDYNQLLKAVHFSNLQPLWKSENRSKGAT